MLDDPTVGPRFCSFTVDDLARMRHRVKTTCATSGLSDTVTDGLVAAANEIVVNAVLYAGGRGRLAVSGDEFGVTVEVCDDGPGMPAIISDDWMAVDALGGRGLWLARRMCDRMTVSSTATGVTVVLFAAHR